MIVSSVRAVACAALLAVGVATSVSSQEAAPPVADAAAFEKGLRESMLLPAGTRMIYRDHEGQPIPLEQFVARAQEGIKIDVVRDEAAGTATFTLAAKTAEEAAIGPVKNLPPKKTEQVKGGRSMWY